jgi:hypothetical protein
MFVNEPDAFQRAEEVRFTDERRRGRMWDGFVCAPDLILHRDGAALDAFKQGIRECFETGNVQVDIFDRYRTAFDGADFKIVQITVYSEGPTDDSLEFERGELTRRPCRPVVEAALTYEPAPGVIEVVAKDREKREVLVRMLARDLRATEFREKRIPLRRYDLSISMRPFTFPTDPQMSTCFSKLTKKVPGPSAELIFDGGDRAFQRGRLLRCARTLGLTPRSAIVLVASPLIRIPRGCVKAVVKVGYWGQPGPDMPELSSSLLDPQQTKASRAFTLINVAILKCSAEGWTDPHAPRSTGWGNCRQPARC